MTEREFEKLIRDYERMVFTVCYQLVRDYHEAENLTQETFLSAYNHRDSCPDDGGVKPWLSRIAANKARDYLKSAYHRHTVFEKGDNSPGIFDTLQSEESIYSMTENKEAVAAVREKILSLKEPYLFVSRMYFLEEKNVEQIARALSRPEKTVRTQLRRAKEILQKMIKEEGQ